MSADGEDRKPVEVGEPSAPRVELDPLRGRLVFHGDCAEMVSTCRAMCCRVKWEVGISEDEYASGRYEADLFCGLSGKPCTHSLSCGFRSYRMRKREDNSCVHLQGDRCSIYADRPRVCRDFHCRDGWRLASVFTDEQAASGREPAAPTRESFTAALRDDMVFVQHPLLKVHAVIYVKARGTVIFVKELAGACGKFDTRESLDLPWLEEWHLVKLIALLARKEPLGEIYARFRSEGGVDVGRREFATLVWLLNRHSIVLDSRYFSGLLAGVGGVG